MLRIDYRFALALSLALFVPGVLIAQQPRAAQEHVAAAPDVLSSIAVNAQPPATATQPPQQAQPPQPPTAAQPPQPTTGAQPTQPPTAPPPTQPTTGAPQPQPPTVQPTQPTTGTQPTQPPTGIQPPQPTAGVQPAPAPAAQTGVDSDGAGALLDRMQIIVNAALGNRPPDNQAVGTSGVLPGVDSKSKAGKVSVDRAALDEILAEVQQLRTMLRVRQ